MRARARGAHCLQTIGYTTNEAEAPPDKCTKSGVARKATQTRDTGFEAVGILGAGRLNAVGLPTSWRPWAAGGGPGILAMGTTSGWRIAHARTPERPIYPGTNRAPWPKLNGPGCKKQPARPQPTTTARATTAGSPRTGWTPENATREKETYNVVRACQRKV